MMPAAERAPYPVLGIDIGGTKVVAAVVRPDGTLGPSQRVPTPARDGPHAVLSAVIGVARAALSEHAQDDDGAAQPVRACGIGTAGTVSPDGVISYATQTLPGWAGTDVRSALSSALGMPTVVLNDVHAAAVGEHAIGAARGYDTALAVSVGTGIGGAIVRNGTVIPGRTGSAGAIGHVPVSPAAADPRGRRCTCGCVDHLEAYASGPAITASYLHLAAAGGSADQPAAAASLPAIASLARSGDHLALSVVAQAGEALGGVVGGLANVLDPDVIVIGGGVAVLSDLLEVPVRSGLARQALPGPAGVELRFSTLGPLAAVIGAAVAARALPLA